MRAVLAPALRGVRGDHAGGEDTEVARWLHAAPAHRKEPRVGRDLASRCPRRLVTSSLSSTDETRERKTHEREKREPETSNNSFNCKLLTATSPHIASSCRRATAVAQGPHASNCPPTSASIHQLVWSSHLVYLLAQLASPLLFPSNQSFILKSRIYFSPFFKIGTLSGTERGKCGLGVEVGYRNKIVLEGIKSKGTAL